ncbi:unnamed protein product [Arabis nemorensis]|uniref:TF-B3 domain-containing protein n=1 Tax=Arabis nemorensis TaxID=586526 RepID=A0A565CAV7_9BRAS|nr:unnamed protein product [Arabis nemorensis]
MIPDEFFSTHLKGKNEFMKLKLTSDAFDKTWEVKLNGRRFAGGWEDFSAAHSLQDDDVLNFRHDGDMFFHVTPSVDLKNISLKKTSRLRTESSSSYENTCLLAVTPSNLRVNRVNLAKHFSRTNGLNKRWCGIDLMNQSGKCWGLSLRHNNVTGQDYIRGGWRSFCRANKLKIGSLYRFKVVRNGTRPMLRLCSDIVPRGNGKAKVSANSSRKDERASMKQNKVLTVTLKPYMLKSRQLRLPKDFARENGIAKAGEITLVDKNGVKWPSYVAIASEQRGFYMAKGWISFCAANGIKMGESFTLEFVRGEDSIPMFKFCSKAKREEAPFDGTRRTVQASRDEEEDETEKPFQKRARVSADGGTSGRIGTSNKSSPEPKNLQRKRPHQPCSISDQLKKVKQSIVDTLTGVRRFRSELEIKEHNLEDALQDIDALGEKVLEINKILK